MNWLPPRKKPWNESAGWLGYYTRTHLGEVFDLMDCDGCDPVLWFYRKRETQVIRFFEEKPHGQKLAASQTRVLPALAGLGVDCYVIHDAERLGIPEFPIRLSRVGRNAETLRAKDFGRAEFDSWLIDGLGEPPTIGDPGRTRLEELLTLPYKCPPGYDAALWDQLDKMLVAISRTSDSDVA